MTSHTTFFHLLSHNIPVLSTADNGPGHKLVRLIDGREIVADSFEMAVAVALDSAR
jgi:hypothetical protein